MNSPAFHQWVANTIDDLGGNGAQYLREIELQKRLGAGGANVYTFSYQAGELGTKLKPLRFRVSGAKAPMLPSRDSETLTAFCVSGCCSATEKAMLHVVEADKKSDCLPAAGYGIQPVCEGLEQLVCHGLRQRTND